MKHLFVPYDIARQLKENGFDEPCLGFWDCGGFTPELQRVETTNSDKWVKTQSDKFPDYAVCSAPLYQQVVDWFRDKHNIYISQSNRDQHLVCRVWMNHEPTHKHGSVSGNNANEALTKAIEEALKLI